MAEIERLHLCYLFWGDESAITDSAPWPCTFKHGIVLTNGDAGIHAWLWTDDEDEARAYAAADTRPIGPQNSGQAGQLAGGRTDKGKSVPRGRPFAWGCVCYWSGDGGDRLEFVDTNGREDYSVILNICSLPGGCHVLDKPGLEVKGRWESRNSKTFSTSVEGRCRVYLPKLATGEFFKVVIMSGDPDKLVVLKDVPAKGGVETDPGAGPSNVAPSAERPSGSDSSARGQSESRGSEGDGDCPHVRSGEFATRETARQEGRGACDGNEEGNGCHRAEAGCEEGIRSDQACPPDEGEMVPSLGFSMLPNSREMDLWTASEIPEGYCLVEAPANCGLAVYGMMKERVLETRKDWDPFSAMMRFSEAAWRFLKALASAPPFLIYCAISRWVWGPMLSNRRIANWAQGIFSPLVCAVARLHDHVFFSFDPGMPCRLVDTLLPALSLTGSVPATMLLRKNLGGKKVVVSLPIAPPPGVVLDDSFLAVDVSDLSGRQRHSAHVGLVVPNDSSLVVDSASSGTYSADGVCDPYVSGAFRVTPGTRVDPYAPVGAVSFTTAVMCAALSLARGTAGFQGPSTLFTLCDDEVHPKECRAGLRQGHGHHHPSWIRDALVKCSCSRSSDFTAHLAGFAHRAHTDVTRHAALRKRAMDLPPADVDTQSSATANLCFFQSQAMKLPMLTPDEVLVVHQYRVSAARALQAKGNLSGRTFSAYPVGSAPVVLSQILGFAECNGYDTCQECGTAPANRHGLCNKHFRLTHCQCGLRLWQAYGCTCANPVLARARTLAHHPVVRAVVSAYRQCQRVVGRNSVVLMPCLHLPAVKGYGRKVETSPVDPSFRLDVEEEQRRVKPPLGPRLLGIAVDPCLPVTLYMNLRGALSTFITRVKPVKPQAHVGAERTRLERRFNLFVRVKARMAPRNHDTMPYVGTKAWVDEVVIPACKQAGYPRAKAEKYIQGARSLSQVTYLKKKDFVTTGMFKYEKAPKYASLHDLGGAAPDPPPVVRPAPCAAAMGALKNGFEKATPQLMMASDACPATEFDPVNYNWSSRMIQYFKTGVIGAIALAIVHSMTKWMKRHYSPSSDWLASRGAVLYAGGLDAVETGEMVANWALRAPLYLCEGDFSKYDSYQSGVLLTSEMDCRKVIHPGLWKHPLCLQVIRGMRKKFKTVLRGIGTFSGGAMRLSGDYFTSVANTENNVNFNTFAKFQLWCEDQGDPDLPITPENIRSALADTLFGVVANGDDHILASTDASIFPRIRDLLAELGMVVVHKRPVPNSELSRVGFLGGYIVRCDAVVKTTETTERRSTYAILPDLERFLSSYCWMLDPLDEALWRKSVYLGWQGMLGTMPIYSELLRKLVKPSELSGRVRAGYHLSAEDRYKAHKCLPNGTTLLQNASTVRDMAMRFRAGDSIAFIRDLQWFQGLLGPIPAGVPAIVRNDVTDRWLRNSRNF